MTIRTGAALHLGVTGSSSHTTMLQRAKAQTILYRLMQEENVVWMHNGDCVGADEWLGNAWKILGGKLHLHPPINPRKRADLQADVVEEERDYMDRNWQIVRASHLLLALPDQMDEVLRSGTWSTIRRARKAKLPIIIVLPNGKVIHENGKDWDL